MNCLSKPRRLGASVRAPYYFTAAGFIQRQEKAAGGIQNADRMLRKFYSSIWPAVSGYDATIRTWVGGRYPQYSTLNERRETSERARGDRPQLGFMLLVSSALLDQG